MRSESSKAAADEIAVGRFSETPVQRKWRADTDALQMKIDIHIHVLPRDRPWEHRHRAWTAGILPVDLESE